MSQFSWEPEVIEQAENGQPAEHPPESYEDPGALALSVDDFSALEDRILRAVNLVKRERMARAEAEARAVTAEARLAEQVPQLEHLQGELGTLRAERDNVRQRVERLLAQLDALEI